MVDETFKTRLDIEIEPQSLSQITKQIEKAVDAAFQKSVAKNIRRTAGNTPAPGGGAATARSARAATGVSANLAKDIAKQVSRENKIAASKIDDAVGGLVVSIDRLIKALERRPAGAVGGGVLGETRRLVDRQVGPSNQNRARDIQKSRLEAGRQTTGSGGTSEKRTDLRTGTKKDDPSYETSARKREAARSGTVPQAGKIQQDLMAWYKSVRESFRPVNKGELQKLLPGASARDIGKVEGMRRPGKGGAPGEILMSFENRVRPFTRALKELQDMANGAAMTEAQVKNLAKRIRAFGKTLAHERIHEANKEWDKSVKSIVRTLRS